MCLGTVGHKQEKGKWSVLPDEFEIWRSSSAFLGPRMRRVLNIPFWSFPNKEKFYAYVDNLVKPEIKSLP